MTTAWEWPAAFSVKHPDSSVLDCSSHSSAVRRWYDSSTPASQGQLLELGSTPPCFTLLFKLCVSDGAIQQKKEWWGPDWDVRNEMKGWSARTDWNRMKGRYEGGWRVEALEGGGGLWATVGLWLKPSPVRACVCVVRAPIGQGAWSETEELYQTWSHNRDSMKISSCYYSPLSWCRRCCSAPLMHWMKIVTCVSGAHRRNTPAWYKNTLPVITQFHTIAIALQSKGSMCSVCRRFCCFHRAAGAAGEPRPLICVYRLSAVFVRHLNLIYSRL